VIRGLLVDVTPLRVSRDYRWLYGGQAVSLLGSQLTIVAVPFQVYAITRSSLAVGLTSLAQLVPLLLGSLLGGAIADNHDRRRLMLVAIAALAVNGVPLAVNASLGDRAALWPVVVFSATGAGLSGFERPARSASLPNLLPIELYSSANALWQTLLQVARTLGPALAGLLLARTNAAAIYWVDVATFVVALGAVTRLRPLPPHGEGGGVSVATIVDGLRYLRRHPVIQGVYLADVDAMVFGMPQALFPAMAIVHFHGGAGTVGLLYAAPGAGALVGALLTGWVSRVRRQGKAVIVAVAIWGLAITAFGVSPWLPLGLVLLAGAGAADVFSAVFRNTILQTSIPDNYRGRLSAVQIAVVTGGPRLGDLEAGGVAAVAGLRFSIVSGGLACVVGIGALAWRLPQFLRYDVATAPAAVTDEST
jgi:MFS family permease